MTILDRLGLTRKRIDYLSTPVDLGIASPWQEGSLTALSVAADIFPAEILDNLPLSRDEALSIPVVARARNLITSKIAALPLEALDVNGPLTDQPTFLYRTNGTVAPQDRMAATVDDLIFYGRSLWVVERGSVDQIIDAYWIPTCDWTLTNGVVLVNEQQLDESQYVMFHVPLYPGLLIWGNRTLRGARDTERAWVARMSSPAYLVTLNITDNAQLSPEEVKAWVATWASNMRAGKPSVGAVPAGVTLETHEGALGEGDLFIGNRNAVRTDVGSFLNIRPSMLDGTAGIDSLTYTTTEGQRNHFYDDDLPFWTNPIESRLSLDDVVPRGQRVRFNKTDAYASAPAPTGAQEAD